jgi:GntR family transcriptional regulator
MLHVPSGNPLTLQERESILQGIARNETCTLIGQRLVRNRSVISREVARNGGRDGYSAQAAQERAESLRRRSRPRRLEADRRLHDEIASRLNGRPRKTLGYRTPAEKLDIMLSASWCSHCLNSPIAEVIRQRIASGEYPVRGLISEVKLEQEFGVARETVRKATAVLREEGLIITTRGMGSFVADRSLQL